MTARRLTTLFILVIGIITFCALRAPASEQSASTTVSVTIQMPAHPHVKLPLVPIELPNGQWRGVGELPPTFLSEAIDEIAVIPTGSTRSIELSRLWLVHDGLLSPLASRPPLSAGGPAALEYHPSWRDQPGVYHGRLIVRAVGQERTADLEVEVPAFASYELLSDAVQRHEGGPFIGRIEILVTSNARTWNLDYRLERISGPELGLDVRLVADADEQTWQIEDRGSVGSIRGRGAVQERRIVLLPVAERPGAACDLRFVVEAITAR